MVSKTFFFSGNANKRLSMATKWQKFGTKDYSKPTFKYLGWNQDAIFANYEKIRIKLQISQWIVQVYNKSEQLWIAEV